MHILRCRWSFSEVISVGLQVRASADRRDVLGVQLALFEVLAVESYRIPCC